MRSPPPFQTGSRLFRERADDLGGYMKEEDRGNERERENENDKGVTAGERRT